VISLHFTPTSFNTSCSLPTFPPFFMHGSPCSLFSVTYRSTMILICGVWTSHLLNKLPCHKYQDIVFEKLTPLFCTHQERLKDYGR
jgi:hypothetical protein